jgi:UDP-N-acetylmuramate dehydrogenase
MKVILEEHLIDKLISYYNQKDIPYKQNIRMSTLCSFKIGGISPLIVEPIDNEQLSDVLYLFLKEGVPYKVLGGGTNLLISDHPDSFVTLRLSGDYKEMRGMEAGIFLIGASANTTPIFRKISLMGYTGVEFLSTIPGWIGGAVIQNAGCYGGEIFEYIEEVECIQAGKIEILPKDKIEYGYRTTQFLKNKDTIITKIKIKVGEGNLEEIEMSLKEKREKRNSSQPENKKSAGSVFKNPLLKDELGNPLKSWWLIDQVGLRGKIQGGAQISPEHCNFIVNLGQASATDVHYLVQLIQEKVFSKFNIQLEREIEYFGEIS